jgi:small subunit ribosomal protein S1
VSVEPQGVDDPELRNELLAELGTVSADDLEDAAARQPRQVRPDTRGRIRGRVLAIRGKDVFVDIGGKSEGFVSLDEFEPDQPPAIDQILDLVPQGFDSESGLMRLSLREARLAADLETIRVGDVVKARVTGSNLGGLELRVHGARGFMPLSQVDLVRHNDLSGFIGQWLECEVTEVDRKGKSLVLSRRRVLERRREEQARQLRFQLAPGQVRKAKVVRLTDFGAFVDLGGVEALLHVSDMGWGRISSPKEVVNVGDEIDVQILKIDLVKDRISVGLKQLTPDPWTLVPSNYQPGQTVEGRVVRLANFGAFVELQPGVEGLIPLSELSWAHHIRHPSEVVKEGDQVRVCVLSVDAANRRISLSLKALAKDPWEGIQERYPPDTVVSGVVMRIADFGAFVQLEEGVEGLVHISQLSNRRVRKVQDAVQVGQVVKVRVLEVDPKQRRLSLSIKAAEPPQPAAEAEQAEATAPEPAGKPKEKKRPRPRRGGLAY